MMSQSFVLVLGLAVIFLAAIIIQTERIIERLYELLDRLDEGDE